MVKEIVCINFKEIDCKYHHLIKNIIKIFVEKNEKNGPFHLIYMSKSINKYSLYILKDSSKYKDLKLKEKQKNIKKKSE